MRSLRYGLLLLLNASLLAAQMNAPDAADAPERIWRYGINLFGAQNVYTASLDGLPGVPSCCPGYSSGSGTVIGGGLLVGTSIGSLFDIEGRIIYSSLGGELRTEERKPVNDHGVTADGLFLHTIEASIPLALVQANVGWRPINRFRVSIGGELGYAPGGSYRQEERLIEPKGIRFENGRRVRMEREGDIPGRQEIQPGFVATVAYEVPLNADGSLLAAPEISARIGPLSLLEDENWRAHGIRGGLLLYVRTPPEGILPPPPTPPAGPPPGPPPPATLVASVDLSCVAPDGSRVECVEIEIDRIDLGNNAALLNYIFFEENSSTIPSRYHVVTPEERKVFSENRLEGTPLEIYYHLLDIVGSRLRTYPEANLRLVGYNADVDVEEGRLDLSRDRAESVRSYLVEQWEIDSSRLSIDWDNLPENASRQGESDGDEENRRVEIESDDWRILRPIVYEETLYRSRTPSMVFQPSATASEGIDSWEIALRQGERVVATFDGRDGPPSEVLWKTDADALNSSEDLSYTFEVEDGRGVRIQTEPQSIPVSVTRPDTNRSVEKYNLIIFPFNSSRLTEAHDRIIGLINDRLESGALVRVVGHTDRTGETSYNIELSEQRAQNVAAELEGNVVEVTGLGDRQLLFNNDLPEGRYYCRTVNITIETPITEE